MLLAGPRPVPVIVGRLEAEAAVKRKRGRVLRGDLQVRGARAALLRIREQRADDCPSEAANNPT